MHIYVWKIHGLVQNQSHHGSINSFLIDFSYEYDGQ